MLSRAEHADADERMEHDGDLHLAAAHVTDIGRLIDDLRPRFECEAARADGDDRVEPGNRCADSHTDLDEGRCASAFSVRYDLRPLFRPRHSDRRETDLRKLREALCRSDK